MQHSSSIGPDRCESVAREGSSIYGLLRRGLLGNSEDVDVCRRKRAGVDTPRPSANSFTADMDGRAPLAVRFRFP